MESPLENNEEVAKQNKQFVIRYSEEQTRPESPILSQGFMKNKEKQANTNIFQELEISDGNINYSNVSSNEIDHELDLKSDADSTEFFIGDKDEFEKVEKILKAINQHNNGGQQN